MKSTIKKTENNPQRKQQMMLGVVCSFLLLILLYQFFQSPSTPVPNVDAAKTENPNRVSQEQAAEILQKEQPSQPAQPAKGGSLEEVALNLEEAEFIDEMDKVKRNPFDYPPPVPPPPAPPPPPPTVPVTSISPTSVYAQTPPFELIVKGSKFDKDMRIYLNANAAFTATKFVSDTELRCTVPPGLFHVPQQLTVEVRKPGFEKEFFSNQQRINVIAPPLPAFEMKGRVSDSNGENQKAVLMEGDNRFLVGVGQKIADKWKVVNISKNTIVVEDIKNALGVRHTVKIKDDGQPTSANFSPDYGTGGGQVSGSFTPAEPLTSQIIEDQAQKAVSDNNTNNFTQNEQLMKQRQEIMRRRQELFRQRQQQNGQPGVGGIQPINPVRR